MVIKVYCKKVDDKKLATWTSVDGEREILYKEFAAVIRAMIHEFKAHDNGEKDSVFTRVIIADILEQIKDEL